MAAMAQAVVDGGAVAIRANGLDDVAAIVVRVRVPIVGLWKNGDPRGVFITPTAEHAMAIAQAGADIVATDGTRRHRPDGSSFHDIVDVVHAQGRLVLADVSTPNEGIAAARDGADLVASTLSGYTSYSPQIEGPDFDLVARLVQELDVPVIAEGRIRSEAEARRARDLGAWAVVVGDAITRPSQITRRFVQALRSCGDA
jgi:N-acylglucosamine-6-phosphate 2-epimerase